MNVEGSSRNASRGLSYLFSDESFAMDFHFDMSLPKIDLAFKHFEHGVDATKFLKPISKMDIDDSFTENLITDTDMPCLDLLNPDCFTQSEQPKMNPSLLHEIHHKALHTIEGTATRRSSSNISALRAPTYTSLDVTVATPLPGDESRDTSFAPTYSSFDDSSKTVPQDIFGYDCTKLQHPKRNNIHVVSTVPVFTDTSHLNESSIVSVCFDVDPVENGESSATYPQLYFLNNAESATGLEENSLSTESTLYVQNESNKKRRASIDGEKQCKKVRTYKKIDASHNANTYLLFLPNKFVEKGAIVQPISSRVSVAKQAVKIKANQLLQTVDK